MTAMDRGNDERLRDLLGERLRLEEEFKGLKDLLGMHEEARAALEDARPTRVNRLAEWDTFRENEAALENLLDGREEARERLDTTRKRLDAIPEDILDGLVPPGLWVRHGAVGVRVDREPGDGRAVLTEAAWPAVEAAPSPGIPDVREQERIMDMGRIERFAHLHPEAPRMIAAVGTGVAASAAFWALVYFFGDDALGLAGGAIEAGDGPRPAAQESPAPAVLDAASRTLSSVLAVAFLALALLRVLADKPAEAAGFVLAGAMFLTIGAGGASLMVGIGEWALGALGLL